jgi:two-component system, OmpR family, alkaline phosphatase synthesis response regulator PhoP
MIKVLVVEDSELGLGLQTNLEAEGYAVELAVDGRQGLERARSWEPDLLVLDLMLPVMEGLEVLRTLRREGARMAVLVLTARGQESDKVVALKLGADDYLTKPFGLLELLARVEALLRRSGAAQGTGSAPLRFGEVELKAETRTVLRGGRPVELTPKEFDLLATLLRAEGAVVSREELLRRVWGYRSAVVTRTLDSHVAELRRKLEPTPAAPRHILTVRKVGYRIER